MGDKDAKSLRIEKRCLWRIYLEVYPVSPLLTMSSYDSALFYNKVQFTIQSLVNGGMKPGKFMAT